MADILALKLFNLTRKRHRNPQMFFWKMISLSIINYFENFKKFCEPIFFNYVKVIIHNNIFWLHRIFLKLSKQLIILRETIF